MRNPTGVDGSSGDKNNPNGGDGSAGNDTDTWNGNQGTNGNPNTTRGDNPLDSPINPNDNGEKIQDTSIKLGINFEDRGYKGDMDYNDDVLCFEGKFRVNKQTGAIISLQDQDVTGYINRNASCGQKIFITITHPDETKTSIVREPAHQQPTTETLSFKKNSLLEVKFQSTSDKCDTNMHTVVEQEFVLFSFDICNQ